MYLLLFMLAAGLNILLGAHDWPSVLGGSLSDPDSYMRLLRIEQGIRAGHLVVVVARDDAGAGVMVEWSRLLDILLWAMAAPLAACIGWHRALFAAGVALGPLGIGALGTILAWVVEPFAARKYLWATAAAAALLPGIQSFAQPGMVHYHILLLVLIALTAGFVVRAWGGDRWAGFLAGVSGGVAIWLTPETMPFILMIFAALLIRWWQLRLGATLLACAAGFFDALVLALTVDPPAGGYLVPEIDRVSLVYVVLAILLLAGSAVLWRMEAKTWPWRRPAGLAVMAALLLGWVAMFPKVAMGPYGILPPDQARKFFALIMEEQPVRGLAMLPYLLPGALALAYALWQAATGRVRWLWLYTAAGILVALALGAKFILFVCFSACAAAALLPLALGEITLRLERQPAMAMFAGLGALLLILGVPELAALGLASPGARPGGESFPSCSLRHIAPLLEPAGRSVVLAPAQDTPELLYRTQVETEGSLYHHGIAGYLRARAAWRAVPGAATPPAMLATRARYVLFCPQAMRYAVVADLPDDTLWDALAAGRPPGWLRLTGVDDAGWRLYAVTSTPPVSGAATPVVDGSESGNP